MREGGILGLMRRLLRRAATVLRQKPPARWAGNWIKARWAELNKTVRVSSRPYALMVEPTNLCNLKCPTCPTGAGTLGRPQGMMDVGLFKRLIDEVGDGVLDLTLHNYGEPFLHPGLSGMIRHAAAKGIRVHVSTNGHFFTDRAMVREVLQSGLARLKICLDGASQESLEVYRVNASFQKVKEGIQLVVAEKRALGLSLPDIDLQFILMRHNEHETGEMRRLAVELGVDLFDIKTVGMDSDDPDFARLAEKYLPRDADKRRYEVTPEGARLKAQVTQCNWIYRTAVVNWDGSMVPCCHDTKSRHVFGNAFRDGGVAAVWQGPAYTSFRKTLREDILGMPLCKFCPEAEGFDSLYKGEERIR